VRIVDARLTASALVVAAGALVAFAAHFLRRDAGNAPPPDVTIRAEFLDEDDLKAWRMGGGEWTVRRGEAYGRQVGAAYAYLTWPAYFGSVSSVTIHGRIASREDRNFRVAVGHVSAIFNWELDDGDIYHDGPGDGVLVRPHGLPPGEHEITFVQDGEIARVLVDGRATYESRTRLRGTVTIYPAVGSEIAVRDVEIRGVPLPWIVVDGPSIKAP
jgi:hypothetical protein